MSFILNLVTCQVTRQFACKTSRVTYPCLVHLVVIERSSITDYLKDNSDHVAVLLHLAACFNKTYKR